jgi:hypothetical protein
MNNTFTKKSNTMKNLSISIEHKDEAIPLLEKLGYKEDTEWNEATNSHGNTHILTNGGTWGFFNHKGRVNTPITIEELRELAGEPAPDKLDILIEQMRELRAELLEFMKEKKLAEVREWNVGDKVRITKKETHGFNIGEVVELIEYRKDNNNDICPWYAKSQSGVEWWISESEAELI